MTSMIERDEVLEQIAALIEEKDFLDLRGVWAKKKRDREDAELRMKVRQEQRQELARYIRSMKTNRRFDSVRLLADIAEFVDKKQDEFRHGTAMHLKDAWPLAWKGWLNIYSQTCCTQNIIPPEVTYRIELTDKGRKILAGQKEPETP